MSDFKTLLLNYHVKKGKHMYFMVVVIWMWIVCWGTEQALMLHEFYLVFHAIMEIRSDQRLIQDGFSIIYVCREMIML